jgi:hypothetical protein
MIETVITRLLDAAGVPFRRLGPWLASVPLAPSLVFETCIVYNVGITVKGRHSAHECSICRADDARTGHA